uniref:Uncharacterized protein n=1 Tax=Anguilla anguilla TaxID=7936 RepID=A0A0E9WV86_ANGAN
MMENLRRLVDTAECILKRILEKTHYPSDVVLIDRVIDSHNA